MRAFPSKTSVDEQCECYKSWTILNRQLFFACFVMCQECKTTLSTLTIFIILYHWFPNIHSVCWHWHGAIEPQSKLKITKKGKKNMKKSIPRGSYKERLCSVDDIKVVRYSFIFICWCKYPKYRWYN